MQSTYDIRQSDMPNELQILLNHYPRDSWESHPGFKDKTRQWMSAHQMFRDLGEATRVETERFIDRSSAPEDFAGRLARYGNALVRTLHGHHAWEDRSYFPELSNADSRFDAGLEILEKDHEVLDAVLDGFTKTANRTIKLLDLEERQARDEAGDLHGAIETIERLLERHLSDEEELAVPIILHHRLRG
ncbi:MAG: hemerythrin domain-containing protein [Hyphomicrobiales bacterium]